MPARGGTLPPRECPSASRHPPIFRAKFLHLATQATRWDKVVKLDSLTSTNIRAIKRFRVRVRVKLCVCRDVLFLLWMV